MLEQVEWGEFKLGDLFEELKVKNKLKKENLSDNYEFPAYSSESTNNGIIGYTNNPEFICDENNPIYITFGDHTRNFNIAKQSFSVLDNVKVLKPYIKKESILLFIISSWKKQVPNLGYSRHWKIAKQCNIPLPVKYGKIDFEFITKFTAELEAKHQAELEAYLKTTGLKNYELTSDELEALNEFDGGKIEWKEFEIGKLFEIDHYGRQRAQEDLQREGAPKYFFVMQNENNNGVVEKVPEQIGNYFNLIPGNSISAFTHLNKVYYQEYPFYSKQGSNVYTLRSDFLDKQNAKFIISIINKRIGEIGYGKNTASRLATYKIQLPIKNNQIDFKFIGFFVSAVEKLIIKDVVIYNQERIKTTKEVIKKND